MLQNWRENISRRVGASGRGTKMIRSRRPGRIRACWMERKRHRQPDFVVNWHRDVSQVKAFTSEDISSGIFLCLTEKSNYLNFFFEQDHFGVFGVLSAHNGSDLWPPSCLLRSSWRDWSFLCSCTDRPPFWGQPWTNSPKCKLWNLSFPLLAVSMETMLMLSDKPSTSYRSHLRDPKTVLEYPKLPLSRLSDVIKWQAPLNHRQADRQTNMSPLARFSQAVTNSAMEWHCLVWADYPFNQGSYLKNGSILQKQRATSRHEETFNVSAGINRNTNADWNRQFHCCSCLKTQWGPGCKDSGASGFGPDRPQRG